LDAQDSSINRLYQKANWLALITIYYNLLEGAVSVFFGFQDETLSLFGFGVDSFVGMHPDLFDPFGSSAGSQPHL